MRELQEIIEKAWKDNNNGALELSDTLREAVDTVFAHLESGKIKVADSQRTADGKLTWSTNSWVKQAVLLSFKIYPNLVIDAGFTKFYDKVPLQFQHYTEDAFQQHGARIVPSAIIRRGAHIGKNCVLMPSYVNIGAYVGENTMVDTWATVGSCAQIGKNVHLSGGVGIGGVLEPLQANPTIIEDNCFIGARSEIVEGIIVEEGSVISMGVYIGKSTRIYNRETGETVWGRVPKGSVVVPGSLPANNGQYSLYAAIIVKQVDESTIQKVGINNILREAVEETA